MYEFSYYPVRLEEEFPDSGIPVLRTIVVLPDEDRTRYLWFPPQENLLETTNLSLTYWIVIAYVVFVKWLGPAWMRNREPFRIKTPMIAYNFILSAFNLYITYRLATLANTIWHLRCRTSEIEYQQFTLVSITLPMPLKQGWVPRRSPRHFRMTAFNETRVLKETCLWKTDAR
ncbi:UNVERIFIED_CONTAM: Elovl7 [Trichonephila clavipes]